MTLKGKVGVVVKQLRKKIETRYPIRDMKLFGSAARGDSDWDSDIDVMVKLPFVDRSIEEDLFNMAYDLELEHDCIIDIIVVSENLKRAIPLYQNIEKEGVAV